MGISDGVNRLQGPLTDHDSAVSFCKLSLTHILDTSLKRNPDFDQQLFELAGILFRLTRANRTTTPKP